MLWELLLLLASVHQGSLHEGSNCTTREEIAQLTRDVENIKHTTREWQNATLHVFRDYIIQQRELQRILEPIASTIQATELSLQDLRAEIQQVQTFLLHAENTTARLQEEIGKLHHILQEQMGTAQHLSNYLSDVCLVGEGIPGTVFASCSHVARENPTIPSGYYFVYDGTGHPTRVYCDMHTHCNISGGWMRAAFLDMTDPGHQCPPAWREITRSEKPRRTCGRTGSGDGCSAALFSSRGVEYNRVRGRVIGYQYGHPSAFDTDRSTPDINADYLDGVSITHGNPRQHIWSFAAASEELSSIPYYWQCPCANTAAIVAVPPFVGQDYFCETGTDTYHGQVLYADDPLWDGENCGPVTSACCAFNNPPWFCKQLPEPTTDDIEVRICGLETLSDQDTPIQLIEIYTTYVA